MKLLKKFFDAAAAALLVFVSPDRYAEVLGLKPKRELNEDQEITNLRGFPYND